MRLISLPSTASVEPYTEYTVDFLDDISVKPFGNITLHSVVINLDPLNLRVNSDNNVFAMNHNKKGEVEITLTEGTYSINSLAIEAQKQIMDSLASVTKTDPVVGVEYEVKPSDGKLRIEFAKNNEATFKMIEHGAIEPIETENAGVITFSRPGGTGAGDTCWGQDPTEFTYGTGYLTAKLGVVADATIGFYDDAWLDEALELDDYTFALQADVANGRYNYNNGGVTGEIAIVPEVNDELLIFFTTGRTGTVTFNVLNNGVPKGAGITQLTEWDRLDEKLYPLFTLSGVDSALYDVDFIPSHFDVIGDLLPTVVMDSQLLFPVAQTGRFLGFQDVDYKERSDPPLAGSFKGEKLVRNVDAPTSLMVELVNFPLECYDGRSGKRKSFMQLIDGFSEKGDLLTWTADYPLPLSLDNKFEFSMQRFSIRLLESDLTPLELHDVITLMVSVD